MKKCNTQTQQQGVQIDTNCANRPQL